MRKSKKKYRINKLRLMIALIVMAALLALSILTVYGAVHGKNAGYVKEMCTEYTVIEVAAGDSVWSLAQSFSGERNCDLRKFVDTICYVNNIDNHIIYPGQELLIPKC